MKKLLFLALSILSLASCSTQKSLTMGERYATMYEEKPLSIAIMPPINQTTHAEAKDYFYTTLYLPLCEKGYYVFSPYLTMEMFQQESAYDAELFLESDLSTFHQVLNADAVMFTIIKDWRRSQMSSSLRADVEYILRSTKTGQTLYHREGDITVDTSVSIAGGGLFGAVAGAIASAVNTAMTDKVVAGRKCNAFVLSDLPAGKYSPHHEVDASYRAGSPVVRATVK